MLDSLGNRVVPPWMEGWDTWWGCANHPDFQRTYRHYLSLALDAGADAFQVDDPAMSVVLLRNGWARVCFCPHCQATADSLGRSPTDIQETVVRRFHRSMKAHAEKRRGGPVPFSCNNFRGDWELFPHDLFDFGVAEAPVRRGNPEYLYAALRETRRRGKAQVFSFVSDKTWLVQKVIASVYASGGNALVPWDVWQGGGQPRYFGRPEDYAPLFAFVKAMAPYLDGYEDAFYHNTQDDPRYQNLPALPLSFPEYRRNTHAFLRARPQDPNAPVVLHLVDWEILTDSFAVLLQPKRFFPDGQIGDIRLFTPLDYEPEAHALARRSGNYQPLAQSQTLQPDPLPDGRLRLRIPKLDWHWAIVVIFPQSE